MKRTWMILFAAMMIADSALAQGRGPGGPGGPGGGRPPGGLGDLLRGLGRGGGGSGDWQQRMQEMARQQGMTFNEAPTLRMSLFEVVQRIGGPEAEAVLLGELNATNRGSEVVELDKLLEKMAGNKYKEEVLMAAHAVLEQESLEPTGFRVDARGNDMLWGLLRKYEDKTFSPQAQAMIVNDEGRFNRGARDYLQYVLGENIMEIYVQLYDDADLELSDDTRRSIREAAGRYMGSNDAANQIVTSRFKEVMDQLAAQAAEPEPAEGEARDRRRGGSDPKRTAEYYLGRLVSTREREVTAETIAGRQALLGQFRTTTSDPEVTAMMDKVGERLGAMAADPSKIRELPRFSLRERSEGGGEGGSLRDRFRNRGGGDRNPGGGGPGNGGARPRPGGQ